MKQKKKKSVKFRLFKFFDSTTEKPAFANFRISNSVLIQIML